MSIFNELLPKINEISNAFTKKFSDDLKAAFQSLDKFEADINGKSKARDQSQKDKNQTMALQSIHEEEDATTKTPENRIQPSKSFESGLAESPDRGPKKRSKHEVDGMESPEIEKRPKRNASVKAQGIISEQVNLNLTKKIRRETSNQKHRHRRDDNKENDPLPIVQVKLEKISLPPEPISLETLPMNVDIKQGPKDVAMPPPPVPKPRKKIDKPEEVIEEDTTRRRTTRTRKQTDTMPAPATTPRETRARRARNKARGTSATDSEKEAAAFENEIASPAEKPRPKRTKRTQKASGRNEVEKEVEKFESEEKQISPKECLFSEKNEVEKEVEKPESEEKQISPKECLSEKNEVKKEVKEPESEEKQIYPKECLFSEKNEVKKEVEEPESEEKQISRKERVLEEYVQSPVLQKVKPKTTKQKINKTQNTHQTAEITQLDESDARIIDNNLEKTKLISQLNCTVTISKDMDSTIVLPNGVYNHAPETPKDVRPMNETVVLDKERALENDFHEHVQRAGDVSSSSLLTDDEDSPGARTPPHTHARNIEHTSAVKEKVQQFEEMASRVTRTKTRAMTKKDEPPELQTPPERSQPTINTDTLSKMNNMIFNGKLPQVSISANKPRTNIPLKTVLPSSTSKVSVTRVQEEERREKEDARRKKEALLEAKREQQRSKREQKMSAAAQARSAAENTRRAALQAAAKERLERQAHADQGRADRLKEAERKRQEQARKAAETEERRRQEEAARAQRRADEQRRADAARRRQQEEASAVKKEAAMMQKEIERRQKEFMERMKMKQRMEGDRMTPHKSACTPAVPMEPVYMQDGFQHLNSDEEEPPERPVPVWSSSKVRRVQLHRQSLVGAQHVDRLFSVREHTPDLREIFPNIERARLKRTSSAVWRTPPRLPPLHE